MERKEAQASGLKRYETGRPCKHGHTAERKTASGNCVVCQNAAIKACGADGRYNDRIKRWRERNPEKVQAWQEARNAMRRGELKQLPCELCGNEATDKHHDDYSKPLEVRWLCESCHGKEHRK